MKKFQTSTVGSLKVFLFFFFFAKILKRKKHPVGAGGSVPDI